ncbi:sodium:calcium antiporter, partial [Romboutsia ilealis]|uniref:sodium:calcium antiporter n=1 Tax=Romboutsia ilealis TaxID=1115758 RepID=UPI003AB9AD51
MIGIAFIIIGSDLTVDSATNIAFILKVSERIVGLTIIAFGTSLPELITSVTAGLKGKDDIAIGNIVGSNIFNILFVTGTAALITPIE